MGRMRAKEGRTMTETPLSVNGAGAAKGFDSVLLKSVAMDPDNAVAAAYGERQQLRSAGALDALSNAYLPPPIKAEQRQPSSADVERARYAKASEEERTKRVLEGRPGITDQDFTRGRCRQVGRNRSWELHYPSDQWARSPVEGNRVDFPALESTCPNNPPSGARGRGC